MRLLISIAAIAAMLSPSLASDVVGTAILKGKRVTLFSDNTWQYEDGARAECHDINAQLAFCGDPKRWQPVPNEDPEIEAQYRFDDANYAEYIFERIGTSNGMTLEAMARLVIENAASFAQVATEKIAVLDQADAAVDGHDAVNVAYALDYEGLPIVFSNTIVVTESYTVQIATFALATDLTEEHRTLHAEFVAATELQ